MPYAIMRFAKRKDGPASALEKHHERKKDQYSSNPDIDPARSHLNYHLIQPQQKYYAEIQGRIEAAKCRVRKDSVRFIDTIITASPEFLAALSERECRRYFEHALEFIKQEVGAENIFSAVVHMDEANPHMHLCFVPLTRDKRLSAKEIVGDRNKLVEWQDKYHDHMSELFPQLERGESAAATKRKHIPTWLFKQANRLTAEMAAIRSEIESIGTFNAGKQKEKLLQLLQDWYPKVNAFENKLKPYAEQIKTYAYNERVLQEKADQSSYRAHRASVENQDLIYQLREYQDLIDRIPSELLEQIQRQQEEMDIGFE